MIKFKLKFLALAAGLTLGSSVVFADLHADRTVLNNSSNVTATVTLTFPVPLSGDLYLATMVNGEYLFFADQGKTITKSVQPYQRNAFYDTPIKALQVSGLGIPENTYPLYQVVTSTGSDPLNFTNWIGGLGGLHRVNFTIAATNAAVGDANGDGFLDDDSDHDGYVDAGTKCSPFATRDRKNNEDRNSNKGENDDKHHNHGQSSTSTTVSTSTSVDTCNLTAPTPASTTPTPTPTPTPPTPPTPAAPAAPATPAANGQALYASSCKSCHSPISKRGKTATAIRSAINNIGAMQSLSGISDADLTAIATYLKAP